MSIIRSYMFSFKLFSNNFLILRKQSNISNHTRITWVDSLKGLLMILVVLGHAIQIVLGNQCDHDHLWNLIYSFHMPAFMAASGYFAYKPIRNLSDFSISWGGVIYCKRRSCQLLLPYLLWSFIDIMIGWNFSWERFLNLILYPDKSFWFLWILFWISIIFVGCQLIATKFKTDELVPVVVTAFIFVSFMVVFDIRILGFQFLSYYFIFYTLGYCIHRFAWLKIKNNVIILILFSIWAFLAWFWNMHSLPSWMPVIPNVPASIIQYAYRSMTAVVALLVIFALSPRLLNGRSKINCLFREIGTISLGIYVVHLVLLNYVNDFVTINSYNHSQWSQISMVFIIDIVISVIVVELLKLNQWTAKFLLGKI